ncbi:ATP-binding cassette sub-family B member 10, mitochondrial-like [Amphibalanus amphitrite]|uniref:ATP-binding cassette sub-family B member 10, mitochondrial-like n=1 Tax=Amphibalanus amphitrite TaxID=1232801 RepID=UPI001C9263B7|nr:ATP-binding cassette sub-family B member 10, mitochondrial-like [Amphibalanus amphitrite]XP_043233713.1 ATP-binding cassette sub-family B member 10, mitochondrial-like [Amphibalanus amphitrite]
MTLVRLLRVAVFPLPRLAGGSAPGPRLQMASVLTSQRPMWRSLFTARPLLQAADKAVKTKVAPRELRRLLALAKPERWKLGGAVCLLLVSSAVTMAVPFAIGRVVDIIYREEAGQARDRLVTICLGLAVVFVIGAAANCGRVYLMTVAGARIAQALRGSVFGTLMRQEVAFFDRSRTGELVNRLSADTALVSQTVTSNISDGLRATAMAAASVSMMFYVSTKLAMVGLAIVPPVAMVAVVYGRYVRKITRQVQDGLAEANAVAEEKLANMRTVRVLAREQQETENYTNSTLHVLELSRREAIARAGFFGMTGLSGNSVILAVLYYASTLVGAGEVTVGDLSAFLLYAAYAGVAVGGLSSFYTELQRGLGASTRLWQLVDRQPELPFTGGLRPESVRGDLTLSGVTFSYPSRPEDAVLQDLSLTVPHGSVMAVVGASGSGKSTIAWLLLRLYDPQAGTVTLDGTDVRKLDPMWLREQIGVVSQEPVLFSTTIRENILYGARDPAAVSEQQLRSAVQQANAAEFIDRLSHGMDTVVGERGVMLSGGQKQRIAIARAILKSPRLLLLDEATSALDSESESLVQEALRRLMDGRTVITIAHRLSTVRQADCIAVLSGGTVAEQGSYEELMARPDGLFRKLVERQTIES